MAERVCKTCGTAFRGAPKRQFCSHPCSTAFKRTGINKKHGYSGTAEHKVWLGMRRRCTNQSRPQYQHYGARGIRICERWDNFENFLADMGPRPGPEYTVEREDNDKNYEPGNCRWATKLEQNVNRSISFPRELDARLRDLSKRGLNFTQMAEALGRSKGSVMGRAYRIGVKSGVPPTPRRQDRDKRTDRMSASSTPATLEK